MATKNGLVEVLVIRVTATLSVAGAAATQAASPSVPVSNTTARAIGLRHICRFICLLLKALVVGPVRTRSRKTDNVVISESVAFVTRWSMV